MCDLTSASQALNRLSSAPANAVLAGAFPFDLDAEARLAVTADVQWSSRWQRRKAPAWITRSWSWGDTGAEAYLARVRCALERIGGDLDKVVLARSAELFADGIIDPAALFAALADADPDGYVFSVDMGGKTLVGASPELLVSVRDGLARANPLAGSARRVVDPVRDAQIATALLASPKDKHEHEIVVAAVADGLAPLCRDLRIPDTPELLSTVTMWHLSTPITARPRAGVSALELALALHPTPAVCGSPRGVARQVIAETEPFDRGFYTGMVGWTDARGDGEWVVTIRCGEVEDDRLRLFAGAGIVAGSTPEAELAETDAKFRTLLAVLGIPEEPDGR
ncbi:isochorismate synthase MenF [Amycolatopsis sp. NPDC059090]|uniref:isochorismate synthase n=1 Tax=Amycolatopsis sp. NPDC059090 TaxID=3346723 RepID=UPI00366DDF06